jgi:hypothetical protein
MIRESRAANPGALIRYRASAAVAARAQLLRRVG